MRSRRINRRNERQDLLPIRARLRFPLVMNRHRIGQSARFRGLWTNRRPTVRPADGSLATASTNSRSRASAATRSPSIGRAPRDRQAVMAKHDPASARRNPADCFPQPLAHPFVGHQPVTRPWGLVRRHAASYSARHDRPRNSPCRCPPPIARAAKSARREANDVTLVAVTKQRKVAEIEPLIAAGVTDFGENRRRRGSGKMALASRAAPRSQAAFDRPASIEQGGRGGRRCSMSSIRSTARRCSRRWSRRAKEPGGIPRSMSK